MALVLIACDTGIEERVLEALREIGVPGYTRIPETTGAGRTGRREGDPIWPGTNSLLFVVAPGNDLVEAIRETLNRIKSEYMLPPALHAFTLACEDLL